MILNVRERTIEYKKGIRFFRVKLNKIEMKILLLLSDNEIHNLEDLTKFAKVKDRAIVLGLSRIRYKVEPIKIKALYKKGYILQNIIHINY